jgi:GPH family glycoside/pentoside/hexuronide:cation symporter
MLIWYFLGGIKMAENENVQKSGPKPITLKTRLLYGFGDYTFSLMTSVETYFFNFFLTNVAGYAMGVVLTITMICEAVDMGISWVYGAIINSTKPGKYGRYRTWLVRIPWLVVFFLPLQYLRLSTNDYVAAALCTISFIISHFLYCIPWVSNIALISVAGGTPEGRQKLASSRATWGGLSPMTFAYIGVPLAAALGPIIGEANRYAGTCFIFAVLMALGYFVNFYATAGYEEIETGENIKQQSKTRAGGKDMVKALIQNPHVICLVIADIPRFLVNFIMGATAAYYWMYVAQNMSLMPRYVFLNGLGAFIGAYLTGMVTKALSGRTTVLICYLGMLVMLLLAFFNYSTPNAVIVFMFLNAIFRGTSNAGSVALYGDAAVYSQWKTGADARGWIMGLNNVPLKTAKIINSFVVNITLIIIGFNAAAIRANPELITPELQRGITGAFTLVPAILLMVGFLLLFFGFRLTKDKVVQYQEEIRARSQP